MQQVSVDEARTRLTELIDAALNGESVAIVTDDEQAVQLVPVPSRRRAGQFGSAKGQIWMSDDFDAPLEDFKEYTG